MLGQWQGGYTGYATGDLTIQIDEYETHFAGRACVFEKGNNFAIFVFEFQIPDKGDHHTISGPIRIQRYHDAFDIARSELSETFPSVAFPTHAEVELKVLVKGLRVSATIYADGKALGKLSSLLTRGAAEKRSKLSADKR